MQHRSKNEQEKGIIKSTRWRYEIIQNKETKQYHLVRKATNWKTLRWTEWYVNKADCLLSLKYPAFDWNLDLLIW